MTATPTELEGARADALAAVRAQLHAFLARRVESPEVADDLTQDVLVRLLVHKDEAVEHPTAWLYRVARNVLIDHYRARGSQRRLYTGDSATPTTVLAEDPFADDPKPRNAKLPAASVRWSTSWPSPTARRSPRSTSTDTRRLRLPRRWGSASPA